MCKNKLSKSEMEYVNMCDFMVLKDDWVSILGVNSGDNIYAGDYGNVVLGYDWLKISSMFKDGRHYVNFAVLNKPKVTYNTSESIDMLDIKYGEYNIKTIINPIWLPSIEQLLELFIKHNRFININFLFGEYSVVDVLEFKKKVLCYYMEIIHELYWSVNCGLDGDVGCWIPISESSKLN